jgi:Fe-S cluster assembly iron-binding protein IscA
MALDEPKENEESVLVNSIDVLIADSVKPLVEGTVVDYVDQPTGKGFVMRGASSC